MNYLCITKLAVVFWASVESDIICWIQSTNTSSVTTCLSCVLKVGYHRFRYGVHALLLVSDLEINKEKEQ